MTVSLYSVFLLISKANVFQILSGFFWFWFVVVFWDTTVFGPVVEDTPLLPSPLTLPVPFPKRLRLLQHEKLGRTIHLHT